MYLILLNSLKDGEPHKYKVENRKRKGKKNEVTKTDGKQRKFLEIRQEKKKEKKDGVKR